MLPTHIRQKFSDESQFSNALVLAFGTDSPIYKEGFGRGFTDASRSLGLCPQRDTL
jgi:hypothetical protein